MLLGGCSDDAADPAAAASNPTEPRARTPSVVVHPVPGDPTRVRVHHADALIGLDLSDARALDIAVSENDRIGLPGQGDAATVCDSLDLLRLAQRTPKLEELRLSGCPSAIHAGLAAFGPTLRRLELVELTLDGVTIGGIGQLRQLESLTLVQVAAGTDPMRPLRKLPLQKIVLRNLAKDSELSHMLDLWPKSLKHVVFEGQWAGHEAMLTLAKADAVEELELRGTRIGNFSLNQIKGLEHLRSVVLDGGTFNDNSPLYFRELPMVRFVCNCSRVGDGGLRSLRHSEGLVHVELRETSITGAGLEALAKLDDLQTLVLLDRDIGSEGFNALANNESLRELQLSGPVSNPKLTGIGALTALQVLRLRLPDIDDRSTEALSKLTGLRVLDLSNTKVSDEGLANLGKLTELRDLRLGRTRITKHGLAHLAKLTHLETLHLDHTDAVDEGVAALAGMPALKELRLDGTLVTDAVIDTLLTFENLERVSLANTVVTRGGVARLETLPKLAAIDIDDIRN